MEYCEIRVLVSDESIVPLSHYVKLLLIHRAEVVDIITYRIYAYGIEPFQLQLIVYLLKNLIHGKTATLMQEAVDNNFTNRRILCICHVYLVYLNHSRRKVNNICVESKKKTGKN